MLQPDVVSMLASRPMVSQHVKISPVVEPGSLTQVPVQVHVSAPRPLITPLDDHTGLNF